MKHSAVTRFISGNWFLILIFIVAKLTTHFLTYNNYELHRDAYLYYSYSEHLAWGYIAVPPSIGIVAKIATFLFGNTTFAIRFFPAIVGALDILIICLIVKELGGKKIAIILAGLSFLLSPAYLHTNALFQPVSFNQFYWLLSGYLILLMIKRNHPKYWIWISIVFGLAFLNKYSIVFFILGFVIAIFFSEYRKLFFTKYFAYSLLLGVIIIMPNLIWQYTHNWPVIYHMEELRERQLVHVELSGFLIGQIMMNIQALWIWLTVLIILLVYRKERPYRMFGWIYLIVVIVLILGSGKPYYALGLYLILIPFGAYFIEKYATKFRITIISSLVFWTFFSFYGSLSFDGIPFYGFDKVAKKDGYRWEDGANHDVPQDMADMIGWKEIGQKVREIYLELDDESKDKCGIYCHHYGQAGAVMFYGKDVDIPQPISFNGSFVFWAPDSLDQEYIIWVYFEFDDKEDPDSLMGSYFEQYELKHVVDNPYFREDGTRIYLCRYPKENVKMAYYNRLNELKIRYNRH